ncbi:MAG: histidine phosphatase family protein [Pseudomonadota bacterium]
MTGSVLFLTHAEVVIDPTVPVPRWGLNDVGRARHAGFAADDALSQVTSIYSSDEQKAVDGAQPVVVQRDLPLHQRADLGENDRSATGFLPPDEFWPVVDQFFDCPDVSVRGWETSRDAQTRIVDAVRAIVAEAPPGDILIVSHGGVSTLLRCHLLGCNITQDAGGPNGGGGNWFAFDRSMTTAPTEWRTI